MCILICIAICLTVGFLDKVFAEDWPQWLGPGQASVWAESGIVERFPNDGLPIKWTTEIGLGYSGPAVAGGKVYLTDYLKNSGEITNSPDGRAKLTGMERVLCFSSETGRLLWDYKYDQPYNLSYPAGPRCTPTIDSGKVYTIGAEGKLLCLEAASGERIWEKEFKSDYDVATPIWGFSAHPLVVGDLLICVVGGKGSLAVAFDKQTGKERWRALSADPPGYCSPTLIEHAGVKQLVIWNPQTISGLDPLTGDIYWSEPLRPSYTMSVTVPRKIGKHLFASGIGHVGAMFALSDEAPDVEVLWRGDAKTAVYSCNTTPFMEGDMIYGVDCHSGALVGARVANGKRMWETFQPTTGDRKASHGTAYIVKHGNRFFLFNETGDLILARMSVKGYVELGRFHVLEPTNEAFGRAVVWSHPAFAEKCVFARNDKRLVCVNLAKTSD